MSRLQRVRLFTPSVLALFFLVPTSSVCASLMLIVDHAAPAAVEFARTGCNSQSPDFPTPGNPADQDQKPSLWNATCGLDSSMGSDASLPNSKITQASDVSARFLTSVLNDQELCLIEFRFVPNASKMKLLRPPRFFPVEAFGFRITNPFPSFL